MPVNKWTTSIITIIIFLFSLLVQASGLFQIPEDAGEEYLLDKIYYYGTFAALYISGAVILSKFIKHILWHSKFKKRVKPELIGKIEDLIITFIYLSALGIIFIKIRLFELTLLNLFIYLIFGIVVFNIRPAYLKISKTGFIQSVRPFKIGDWIKLHSTIENQQFSGRVTGFDMRSVKLRSMNNTDLIIPNTKLSTFVVENYSSSGKEALFSLGIKIRSEYKVGQVKRILRAASKEALNELFENYIHTPEVLLIELSTEMNNFRIDYLSSPFEDYSPDQINDRILAMVQKHFVFAEIENQFNILRSIEIFNLLDESDLTKLFQSLKRSYYKEGEIIIKQGDPGDSMFILQEGLLSVYIDAKEKNKIKVGSLSPGMFFGEISLFTGQDRQASVITEVESLILEINKEAIKDIIYCQPQLIEKFGEIIAGRQAVNLKMMDDFLNKKESFILSMISSIKTFFGLK